MEKGNAIVEQIRLNGQIVQDYGEILSRKELDIIIQKHFGCDVLKGGKAYGTYNGIKYCLVYVNISYLGNPHPIYKKRIQISKRFLETYTENKQNGIETYFIGIYKYQSNIVFVNYDTKGYLCNKLNNSSAHIMTSDLCSAVNDGTFYKVDHKNNELFCFRPEYVNMFFNTYLLKKIDKLPRIYSFFNDFYDSISHEWNGIDCYNQMYAENYHRKAQGEWAGSYMEFLFEKYVYTDFKSDFCLYQPERGKNGIDLDLYFPEFEERGDLKMHSMESSGIIGNKTEVIKKIVDSGKSIYYIVFNHNTEKDKDHNYQVTNHWYKLNNKENGNYGKRMKYSISIINYSIIKIDRNNYHYLVTDFQTSFKNSDGSPRSGKIKISKRSINNFIIYNYVGNKN